MLFNRLPFKQGSSRGLKLMYEESKKDQINFPDTVNISDDLKGILIKMLKYNEEDRYSIFELREHPYFKQAFEIYEL